MNPFEQEETHKQILELLDQKLLFPSNSHYYYANFLVNDHAKQVCGKPWLITNYKPLNNITIPFPYSILT